MLGEGVMAEGLWKYVGEREAGWGLACLGLALCITSKEAVRYTALWTFELKSPLLMATVIALMVAGFGVVMASAAKGAKPLWKLNSVLIGLVVIQCAGMTVHTLRMSGMAFPEWASFASSVAVETSFFLLVVFAQYLLTFSWADRLGAFVWGIVGAGVIQVLLVFVSVDIARWLVAASSLMAAALLVVSRSRRPSLVEGSGQEEGAMPAFSMRDMFVSPKSFSGYCAVVFLVSVVLMGAYSQWRGQQDGYIVSILVQVCSGFGLMLPGLAVAAMGRSLHGRSLFYICQTIVLPIALGALYLATVFSGPSISLSVLLFDAAYGVLLFVIWIAPKVFDQARSFIVVCAGLLSYKLGWFVGVFFTASMPQDEWAWLGNAVVVIAFLLLVAASAVFLVGSYRAMEGEASTGKAIPSVAPLEEACGALGEACGLTEREREVLFLLAKGRTASYIARDLVVSESTVRTHIAHIYRKTDVNSQQQLLDRVEHLVEDGGDKKDDV